MADMGERRALALGLWLSTPNVAALEIAAGLGFRRVVLDIEHGSFDLAALDAFIPLCRLAGLEVLAKVLAPERSPIQQALDFGADAVVIPHVADAAHAAHVSAFGKFPPAGTRSYAGGRTVGYAGPDAGFFERQNAQTRCLPMIETEGAWREIEAILALPTVDGVFVGPSDLSLRRGRGRYARSEADWQDLEAIAAAAARAGKPWIMPAWSRAERKVALRLGVGAMVCAAEHAALHAGLSALQREIEADLAAPEPR